MPGIQEHIFIKNPDYEVTIEVLVANYFTLLFVQNNETGNSIATKLLHEKILKGGINEQNILFFLMTNRRLISQATGIEVGNYLELLKFLQELETRLK